MTTILALDTATDACSAALRINGKIFERFEIAPRKHTDLILPMIDSLFAEAAIDASALDVIAFGAGPGSFTGVRIATSIAQGLGLAHETPTVAVSCLALIATAAARSHACNTVVPVMDARKQQIYSAIYAFDDDGRLANNIETDWMGEPDAIKLPESGEFIVCGFGVAAYQDVLSSRCGQARGLHIEPQYPRAGDAIDLAQAAFDKGEALAPELARPIYLRDPL